MFQRLLAWFQRIPIDDPVDHRNGVFLQLLLLCEGLRMPLNKLYLLLFNWSYLKDTLYDTARTGPRVAIAIDLSTDVAMTLAAWVGIWLVRRGRFRQPDPRRHADAERPDAGTACAVDHLRCAGPGFRDWGDPAADLQ